MYYTPQIAITLVAWIEGWRRGEGNSHTRLRSQPAREQRYCRQTFCKVRTQRPWQYKNSKTDTFQNVWAVHRLKAATNFWKNIFDFFFGKKTSVPAPRWRRQDWAWAQSWRQTCCAGFWRAQWCRTKSLSAPAWPRTRMSRLDAIYMCVKTFL